MASTPVPESIRSLAEQLPFGLDASAEVGEVFQRWYAGEPGAKQAKDTVDIWTYCYVRRYFLYKLAGHQSSAASDLDELVDKTFKKVEKGQEQVRQPKQYPHWVSVVCKNTYRNYLRRTLPPTVSVHEEDSPVLSSQDEVRQEFGLARAVVERAIARLPAYLQQVTRLRLLEARPYPDISEMTDIPIATVRTYAGRGRKRLAEDPEVLALTERPSD